MTEQGPEDHLEMLLERRAMIRTLVERRRVTKVTQAQIAAALRVSQAWVSELESRTDWRASTIARYARAVGYRLTFEVDDENADQADPGGGGSPHPGTPQVSNV